MNTSQLQATHHLITSVCPAVLHVNASGRPTSSTKDAQEAECFVIIRTPHETTLVDADHELTGGKEIQGPATANAPIES